MTRLFGIISSVRLLSNIALAASIPKERIGGAIYGSLVADALTLGSHYEYDARVIKSAYGGTISEFMGPGEKMGGSTHGVGWGRRNYHPGQKKGDQTDYGLYVMLALEYFANHHIPKEDSAVNFEAFLPLWAGKFTSNLWGAWVCTQTKQALGKYIQQGKRSDEKFVKSLGGMSNAMGIRSPAALGVYEDIESLVQASDDLMFTHVNMDALAGGEFFTRLAHKIVHSEKQIEKVEDLYNLMEKSIDEMEGYRRNFCKQQLQKGHSKFKEATNPDMPLSKEEYVDDLAATSMARLWDVGKTEPIKVGKASPTEGTMPTSIYLILKYFSLYPNAPGKAFAEGVRANAMIGGDNASRSVAVGMVLGAIAGTEEVFGGTNEFGSDWKDSLNTFKQADKWTNQLGFVKMAHTEL